MGSAFLGDFATWNVGARSQLNWRALSFIAAMSATGASLPTRREGDLILDYELPLL